MRQIDFACNEVIFKEGAYAETMYEVESGKVGIYAAYQTPKQRQLAVLGKGETFGEMGLVECYPRSATAVSLEDNTVLTEVTFDEFMEYMKREPDKVLSIMRQVSGRLRETDAKYKEACLTVRDAVDAERKGSKRDHSLRSRLSSMAKRFRRQSSGE